MHWQRLQPPATGEMQCEWEMRDRHSAQ
ncbi:hypothetical protein CCHR01_07509 [Colletotrichum chrysophilum]|uniref:Uncharacterized protein n=1 Tax=Colletotrichum chrysophilum TaxID=1836956 RepID=A0AAD9AKF8_9PEZI|nr:hypothetical protein CCHR01_07509 [Colletotrichum chrysophilum]